MFWSINSTSPTLMDQKSESSGYCQTFSWAVGNALPSSLKLFLLKHHLENPINSFPKPPRYFTFHFEQWITGNCRIQTILPSRPKTQILSAVGLGWFHPGSWIQNWGIDKVSCSPLSVQQIPNLAPVEISCRSSDQKSDKRRTQECFVHVKHGIFRGVLLGLHKMEVLVMINLRPSYL